MKPFDLEAAKAGAAIQTRDGRKAKFLGHFPDMGPEYRIVFALEGYNCPLLCSEGGKYLLGSLDQRDLFMAPATITEKRWIVWRLNHDRSRYNVFAIFDSESRAQDCRDFEKEDCQIREITETFEI